MPSATQHDGTQDIVLKCSVSYMRVANMPIMLCAIMRHVIMLGVMVPLSHIYIGKILLA